MGAFRASTQYGDGQGTVSITWHANYGLHRYAESIGVPSTELAIGIRIWRAFGVNRTGPEDKHVMAETRVSILTVKRSDLGSGNVVDYFESTEPERICYTEYSKKIENIDELLDYFKEIELVALNPKLAEMDLDGLKANDILLD